MCLDPHAVAKIETRATLDRLETWFESMAASDVEISKAGLALTARLKQLLDRCDESFSRRWSELALEVVIRVLAEVVLRIIGISYCSLPAATSPWSLINDIRRYRAPLAPVGRHFSGRLGQAA